MKAYALSLRLETVPGGDGGSPQDFGHVLDTPGRDAGQARFDDCLLDAGLAPAVALDHGGLEGRAAQLGDPELDLSAGHDQLSLVVPAAVGFAARCPPVALGADEPRRLLVGQRVYGAPDGLLTRFLMSPFNDSPSTDTMFPATARVPFVFG